MGSGVSVQSASAQTSGPGTEGQDDSRGKKDVTKSTPLSRPTWTRQTKGFTAWQEEWDGRSRLDPSTEEWDPRQERDIHRWKVGVWKDREK